jgi:transposase InsO family protein
MASRARIGTSSSQSIRQNASARWPHRSPLVFGSNSAALQRVEHEEGLEAAKASGRLPAPGDLIRARSYLDRILPPYTLYVLFFIRHGRRELVHFNVTASPTAAWIWRQLLEATPWRRYPSHLIHDRDAVYGRDLDTRLARLGISGVRTPFRAPRANAVAERVVRTFRTECLDHLIVIHERHLHSVLTEFVEYYNHERPHRALALDTPVPRPISPDGRIVSRPILGGLHHSYARAA